MPPKIEVEVKLVFDDEGCLTSVLDKNNKKITKKKRKPGDPNCTCPPGKRAILFNGDCYCV